MRRAYPMIAVLVLCVLCQCHRPTSAGDRPSPAPHRSPIDVAILPDGRRAVVANHTADSLALVDLQSLSILSEISVGRRPAAVAVAPSGKHVAVSNHWSHDAWLFDVRGDELSRRTRVPVGNQPRGLAFSRNGAMLYVAVAGADEVVGIDVTNGLVRQRWPAPREPRQVAVSADGHWLAAASSRSAQIRCWDLATGKLHWERAIDAAFNLRGLAFTPDSRAVVCAHVIRRDFPVTKAHIEEGWVIDSRLTRLPVAKDAAPPYSQIALDVRGEAMGDPHGLAFSPDGKQLAVTGSGTHEIILLETANLPWAPEPGDFIDGRLLDGKQHRRLALGGRPLTNVFSNDGRRLLVANYLSDALQVVDVAALKMTRIVALGGPKEASQARLGETLFYDAQRSHNQWFSCHTCHADGHTSGMNFDTLNDDSFGTPKLTPTLRNVTKTAPWTWHGWQRDLGAAVKKSFTETMYGPEPSKAEVEAVVAFLGELTPPPRLTTTNAATARGAAIFNGKARCARCHAAPLYTSAEVYDVNLDSGASPYAKFNPPSLLGLNDRGPYLHDGRGATLQEVLRTWHTPRHIGGAALTPEEERDLLAFLRDL